MLLSYTRKFLAIQLREHRPNPISIYMIHFSETCIVYGLHSILIFFWRGRLRNRHFLFGVYACVIIHSWNLRATERSTFLEASVRPSGDCWGYFSYGLKGAILRQFADSPFGYIFAKGLRFALMNLETWVVEMTGSQVSFFLKKMFFLMCFICELYHGRNGLV